MIIDINEKEIMTDVINYNGTLHSRIRDEITSMIIEKMVASLEEEYFTDEYYSRTKDDLKKDITKQLEIEQRNIFRKILSKFWDEYRWNRNDSKLIKMREAIEKIASEKEEKLINVDE